jgi:hypothetical protein
MLVSLILCTVAFSQFPEHLAARTKEFIAHLCEVLRASNSFQIRGVTEALGNCLELSSEDLKHTRNPWLLWKETDGEEEEAGMVTVST